MSPFEPIHIHPTAPLAESVLLPGDPGRALALAQALLERPLMFNHHRGLWGYTGTSQSGLDVTIQSTGMGGPSCAIVVHELLELGMRRAIRVGSCGALDGELQLGDLLVAREALCADGTSRSLGAGPRAGADPTLAAALERASPPARPGAVVSVDLFYRSSHPGDGNDALAVEMESATLFALGALAPVPVASMLAVSDLLHPEGGRQRITDSALAEAALRMGAAALQALTDVSC